MRKRIVALLLLVVILTSMLPGARAAGALFFVGVNNDIPVLLSGDTSPFYANGKLYAPYTVFSSSPGGVNVSYDVDQGTFALFTLSNTVVFDLSAGTMSDKSGADVPVEIIYRNGVLYLPIEQAMTQFGLSVSLINSKSGCLVLRFKDGTEIYDDETFLDKSELFITHMLDTYGGQTMGEDIVSENEQEPLEEDEPLVDSAEIYLAFTGDAFSQGTLGHLEALEYVSDRKIYATFFLTETQIRENKQLVRDIYSAGHQLGLTVSSMDHVETALLKANEALDETVYMKSLMVLLPEDTIDLPSYRVFSMEQAERSLDAVLENPEVPTILLCDSDVAALLEQLSLYPISVSQLLETTVLPKQIETEQ